MMSTGEMSKSTLLMVYVNTNKCYVNISKSHATIFMLNVNII